MSEIGVFIVRLITLVVPCFCACALCCGQKGKGVSKKPRNKHPAEKPKLRDEPDEETKKGPLPMTKKQKAQQEIEDDMRRRAMKEEGADVEDIIRLQCQEKKKAATIPSKA